jgi:cytochrome d ubiquinol oxidase subunit II
MRRTAGAPPPRTEELGMLDYATLRVIWWLLLGALLIGFAVTDGFDLGLAALFRWLGRDDDERRALLETIEPFWDGNQVWLILGGGAVFAAWPLLYAASFSGLYLAMLLILLALILRPVSFFFRNKLAEPRWRDAWDWALFVSGVVPALLFGVAFGNLFLGVPFHIDDLGRPVYTGAFISLLHPFALLAGAVSLAMLAMHGATYAALKVGEPMAGRARRAASIAAVVLLVAFTVAGVWLMRLEGLTISGAVDLAGPSNPLRKTVQAAAGAWLGGFAARPAFWLAPIVTYVGGVATLLLLRVARPGLAFIASSLATAGVILTAGLALFPFLLPSSSVPGASLTVWDASSSQRTLFIMLLVTVLMLPIVLIYTSWVFHVMRGTVTLEHVREKGKSY